MHGKEFILYALQVSSVLVGLMGRQTYGDSRLSPKAAKQVLDQFIARVERIEKIDVRFSIQVEHFHEAADLDPAQFPDYTQNDGRYIYDVLNNNHYLECRDSRDIEGLLSKTALKQGIVRKLSKVIRRTKGSDEKERSIKLQVGSIHDNPPVAFGPDGPDYFMRVSHFQWMRNRPLEGSYAIWEAKDGSGDVRLVVRYGNPLGDLGTGIYKVYTLSAARGFAPYRLRSFTKGKLRVEAEFNLHEVEPGLWLTTSGVATIFTAFRVEPIAFMQKTFEAVQGSIVVNGNIAVGQFNLPFPPGTSVSDSISKSFYVDGLKSGQGLTKQVNTFRKHANIMAPKNKDSEAGRGSESPTGTVVASYRASWYQNVSFWLVTGSVFLVVVGIFLVRRAG